MIKALRILIVPVLLLAVTFSPAIVQAETQKSQTVIVDELGVNSGGNGQFNLPNNTLDDSAVTRAVQTILTVAGAVSVIFVAVGGLRYVISDGNDQKIKQAKDTITYSIVGLIVSLSAYAIVQFFIGGIF